MKSDIFYLLEAHERVFENSLTVQEPVFALSDLSGGVVFSIANTLFTKTYYSKS